MIKLYDYQEQALRYLPPKVILAWDTGTGKTFASLAHYDRHNRSNAYGQNKFKQPLLILAPASKVNTGDWERDLVEWYGDNLPEYEIISYEKIARFGKKYPNWFQFSPLHGSKQYAVIADECHRIKNPQSKASRAAWEISKGGSFFAGLSATPMPNGWIDFAGYSKIFGFTKGITEFKKTYCNIVTYKGYPEIKSYNRVDELKEQWQSISKGLSKAEANDLPDRTFVGVDFKRPNEYAKTLVTRKNKSGELLDSAPKLAHALRQTLTAGKLDYLSDLIEGTNENIVIFYNYISERKAILDMLKKKHKAKTVFRQDGEKHELPKKDQWANITNSVTVSHYRSGSTGVEMTYATLVVYFSPTYSYADYIQSIGRVYRHGQTNKTTFYNFRTPNSIEEDVYTVLKTKNDFQAKQWLNKTIDK